MAGGEQRIIGPHRARADDDGIKQSAQPVGVQNILRTADPERFARNRGNPPIDCLGDAAQDQAPIGLRCQQPSVKSDWRAQLWSSGPPR